MHRIVSGFFEGKVLPEGKLEMSTKKEELSFLEPVDAIPKSKKAKESTYDKIINEFMESGLKLAKIKPIEGKKPKSMFQSLYERIKDRKYPFKVKVRGEDLYLEKK